MRQPLVSKELIMQLELQEIKTLYLWLVGQNPPEGSCKSTLVDKVVKVFHQKMAMFEAVNR